MDDTTSRRTNISDLHPTVRDAVAAVQKQLDDEALDFKLFEIFRTPQRQRYLYAQGRTTPGPHVTNAGPWDSYHQYGLAVDFVLFENNQWSWDTAGAKANAWRRLHEIGRAHGLEPLSWELPHLQMAGLKIQDLRAGAYPPGGDESWTTNLEATIASWDGAPASPPAPHNGFVRPGLPTPAPQTGGEKPTSPASVPALTPRVTASADNFERAQEFVRQFEGGFVNDSHDRGGATNYGITIATLGTARGTQVTPADVAAMSYDEAKSIYKRFYWTPMRCSNLPGPIALAVYNIGVHCGSKTAGAYLQRALNARGAKLDVDGDIGGLTLDALKVDADHPAVAAELIDLYEARLRGTPNFAYYRNGFLRRVDALRHAVADWFAENPSTVPSHQVPSPKGPMPMPATAPQAQPALDIAALLQQILQIVAAVVATQSAPAAKDGAPTDLSAQLQAIVDGLAKVKPSEGSSTSDALGPVNGAIGSALGNLLNGKKSAIGIVGALLTQVLTTAPTDSIIGKLPALVPALSGMGPTLLPIFLAVAAWGFLGKFEKWSGQSSTPAK